MTENKRRPWARRTAGFEDTTSRRVEVRMAFLGLTQAALGEAIGNVSGDAPMSQVQVWQYIAGRRPWRRRSGDSLPQAIDKFAAAMGVKPADLEPGAPWDPLVRP